MIMLWSNLVQASEISVGSGPSSTIWFHCGRERFSQLVGERLYNSILRGEEGHNIHFNFDSLELTLQDLKSDIAMEGEAGIRNSVRMKNADTPFATSIDEEFSYQRNSGSTILQLFQENMPSIGRWPQLAVSKGSDATALSTGCRRIIFKETLYLGQFVFYETIIKSYQIVFLAAEFISLSLWNIDQFEKIFLSITTPVSISFSELRLAMTVCTLHLVTWPWILQHNCCMSFVHLCDTCDSCWIIVI